MHNDDDPLAAPEWFSQTIQYAAESHFFKCDNIRLHYLSWGAEHSSKPALIFLHGFRGHAKWWAFIAPFFTSKYRVYALDFSGMGDSDHRENYNYHVHADEINAFVSHLSIEDVTLVAHSFGGGRAFRAASEASQPFTRVIGIDAHMAFEGDVIDQADPAPQRGLRLYSTLEEGMARFRLAPKQDCSEPYVLDYLARHSLKQVDDQWSWKFDPYMKVAEFLAFDAGKVLANVRCPVDYVYGDQSSVVSKAMAERIFSALPQPGRLIVVPGAYHHLMASHPVALLCTLQALL
jgi:pimeloyl-ACP methyl ester carboxylesterase